MAKAKVKTTAANSNTTTSPSVSILLKDGTQLNVVLNGSTYESAEAIPDGVLTDDNLSEMTIDGESVANMKLISAYPWEEGTRFAIREMTEQEIENAALRADLLAAEMSVAELTIIMSSMMI